MANATAAMADVLELREPAPPLRAARDAKWLWLRDGFLVFAVLVLMGVHLGLNGNGDANTLDEDRLAPLLHAMVLVGVSAIMLASPVRVVRGLARAWPFLALPAFTGASALWSNEPAASLSATASLVSVIALAIVCASVAGTSRACRIQAYATVAAAVASIAAGVLIPGSGFDTGENAQALRGVFTQKNSLGDAMLVGIMAIGYLVLREKRVSRANALMAALMFATTLLSRSVTALMLATIVAAATFAVLLMARRHILSVPAQAAIAVAVAAVAAFYVADAETALSWVGKKVGLTGRAAIWNAIHHFNGPPTPLGAGYSAFWSPQSGIAQAIWHKIHFVTQSAHNGYLQTQLELGTVGLALFLFVAAATLVRIALTWWSGARTSPYWALIVLMVIALFNADEVSWPRPDIHMFQWALAYLACRMRLPTRTTPVVAAADMLDLGAYRFAPPRGR